MTDLTQLALDNNLELHPLKGMDGYGLFQDGHIMRRFDELPTADEFQVICDEVNEPVKMSEENSAAFWEAEYDNRKRRRNFITGRYK